MKAGLNSEGKQGFIQPQRGDLQRVHQVLPFVGQEACKQHGAGQRGVLGPREAPLQPRHCRGPRLQLPLGVALHANPGLVHKVGGAIALSAAQR